MSGFDPAVGEVHSAAIIVAAGSSRRMGGGAKKEYRILPGGKNSAGEPVTVLGAVVETFLDFKPMFDPIVIVHPLIADGGEAGTRAALGTLMLERGKGRLLFVPGGATRQNSVYRALTLLKAWRPDFVLIHDGARPWVPPSLIERVLDAARREGAALPVLPLTETPKLVVEGFVDSHLKRESVVAAQTPQGFLFNELLAAHEAAANPHENSREYTDDAEIYAAGFISEVHSRIACVEGDILNRKITFASDL